MLDRGVNHECGGCVCCLDVGRCLLDLEELGFCHGWTSWVVIETKKRGSALGWYSE